ncbi:MAG: methionine--tRNA ligase [Nitrososphaeraceae archaeon]
MKKKSAVVTSALPYANGEIHLGHIASTYLPADIFTKYSRLAGREIYHICASDDFGTPVLIKAEKENKSPAEYVHLWNKRDYDDFKSFGISFDFFYMTSSKENIEFVQYVFKRLYENGHIYAHNVIQFYCQFDDKFLPDRYVVGKCPNCGAENQYSDLCEKCGKVPDQILEPKCSLCCRPPIKRSSKHYFFKLSNFSKQLEVWLTNNENLQPDIKNYVINWINEGLQDWDITRDLSWGVPIPLPDAKGKVFYGWFDNHLCYISSLITHIKKSGKDGKKYWNDSEIYHFIGKDIVYHHYLFLPAVRMGIGEEYKLPDQIPSRGHLMLHNQKISKSRNWYIGLRDFISAFNPDYLRFYIASITTYSQVDMNFDWNAFAEKINNELIANIGNFINRALSFVQKTFLGRVPEPSKYDSEDKDCISEIERIADEVGCLLSENELDKALKRILKFTTYFNQYFQRKQPWSNKTTASTTLFIAVNGVRSIAIMLEPFIPSSCEKIWSQLGMSGSIHEQQWKSASQMKIAAGHILGNIQPLFSNIESKEIEQQKTKMGKQSG